MKTSDYIRLRDGGICVYCKDAIGQQIDHVLPRMHGGKSIRGNLVLACTSCNITKTGNLNEAFITKAFIHLSTVGESLDWVNEAEKDLVTTSDTLSKLIRALKSQKRKQKAIKRNKYISLPKTSIKRIRNINNIQRIERLLARTISVGKRKALEESLKGLRKRVSDSSA